MLSVEPESRGTKMQIPWLKPPVCSSQQCSQGIQFSSVIHSCLTFCNTMDGSTPGFPVHHQLPKLAQTPVHWVGDAIQPSHRLYRHLYKVPVNRGHPQMNAVLKCTKRFSHTNTRVPIVLSCSVFVKHQLVLLLPQSTKPGHRRWEADRKSVV